MSRQRSRDTTPEVKLRRALHARGLRFRLHVPIVGTRRTIDVALPRYRLAVFIDGCFWHGCSEHKTVPQANKAWWTEKIAKNRLRDRTTDALLENSGWRVLRVWEHEDPVEVAHRICVMLER